MIGSAFDLLLGLLIAATAMAAIAGRDTFRAVVFFVVYGVLIALAWLRIGAIDVALAEAAMGAGLTGVLLLGAQARLARIAPLAPARRSLARRAGAAVIAGGISLALAWTFLTLPTTSGLQPLVMEYREIAGANNPVTAVLLNFRAWDTLLETVVLLAALLGIWTVSDDRAWGQAPGQREWIKPHGVMTSFGRLLPPLGLVIGVHLVWVGSEQAGGAFQGSTVLAAIALLLAMTGHLRWPAIQRPAVRLALIIGPTVFLLVGLAGLIWGSFLQLPSTYAKALILAIEGILTVSLTLTLVLLVAGPPEAKEETT